MKMRNEDVRKITQIKQYLLDPPITFKLTDYAIAHLKDAKTVLSAYSNATEIISFLQNIIEQLKNKTIAQEDLRSTLKQAAITIGSLTNK